MSDTIFLFTFLILTRSFLVSLLLLLLSPFFSFAQSLAPIPEVGPGVCVSNCGSNKPTMSSSSGDTNATEEKALQSIQDKLQETLDLNSEALKELDQEDYEAVSSTIRAIILNLKNYKVTIKIDPDLSQLRKSKPGLISKINRVISISIIDYKKASSAIDRITQVAIPRTDEGLVLKLSNDIAKRLGVVDNRIHHAVIAVTSTRG